MKSSIFSYVAIGLILALAAYVVSDISLHPDQRQWDFKSYYCAAKAADAGGNPYDAVELRRFSEDGHGILPFVYPPPTLLFFRIFSLLSYPVAFQIWLVLKLLLLIGLIFVWRKQILPGEPALPFYLFLLLAFGATIYFDLVTGNVTILEQFLLWLGLAFLLRGKPAAFCVSVVMASCFKLTPVLFLLLLPALGVRRCWRYLGSSAAAFFGLGTISYLADPLGWQRFFASLAAVDEPGLLNNPSLLSFFKDVTYSIAAKLGGTAPPFISVGLYLVSAVLILWFSVRCWRAIRPSRSADRDMLILFLFCVTFALVMPRFKTYAFVLLVPPAYYAIRRNALMPAFAFILALCLLKDSTTLPIDPYPKLFWQYYLLLLAFMIWGLLLRHARAVAVSSESADP